ncbi:hypothetical protein ACRDNQ_03915 [Palleronia sp. KMU-117]|uniref:hypothetical protein n=1 Tax=Palleronia sp. KMU-117 TaxID=3434108 RepID=UPI003D72935C
MKGDALTFEPEYSTEVREVIGYWRKANQIHGWFVRNAQGGKDDCREYPVSRDQLRELLKVVQEVKASTKLIPGKVSMGQTLEGGEWVEILKDGRVMANTEVAERLLPVCEGFFFGSYAYDQDYYDDLVETERILKLALDSPADVTFTYQSSW